MILNREEAMEEERDWQQLRTRLLIAGLPPEQIPKVLADLDGEKHEDELGLPEFAEALDDEEMQEYQPFSAEESEEAIRLMRRFGVALS